LKCRCGSITERKTAPELPGEVSGRAIKTSEPRSLRLIHCYEGSNTLLSADRFRRWMRWAMAIFYLGAGFIHLQSPATFLPIMPNWAPAPREVIQITGVCEIAGALGLVTRSFRWWAAMMLALYAVCVFPANIKHAFENVQLPQLPSSWWYHGPRLALQPVIVWWTLYCGNVISWPFRSSLGSFDRDIR
jgi:uncharacterized membrane protein